MTLRMLSKVMMKDKSSSSNNDIDMNIRVVDIDDKSLSYMFSSVFVYQSVKPRECE